MDIQKLSVKQLGEKQVEVPTVQVTEDPVVRQYTEAQVDGLLRVAIVRRDSISKQLDAANDEVDKLEKIKAQF